MEDVKAIPADFEIGDFSERTEPLGPFCVWHGYFGECPECKGSVERWTFTVVQADDRALVIDEAWTTTKAWSGSSPAQTEPVLPRMSTEGVHLGRLNRQERDSDDVPAPPDHVPLRVNPGLLARIRLLLEERA